MSDREIGIRVMTDASAREMLLTGPQFQVPDVEDGSIWDASSFVDAFLDRNMGPLPPPRTVAPPSGW